MYRLTFLNGPNQHRKLVVHQGALLIGRQAECHVRLPDDPACADRHARLEEDSHGVTVTALDPSHPVRIDGQPTAGAHLHSGQVLLIGQTQLLFQVPQDPGFRSQRRTGVVHALMVAAVVGIIVLEAGLIAWLSFWKRESPAPTDPSSRAAATSNMVAATQPDTISPVVDEIPAAPDVSETSVVTQIEAMRAEVAALRAEIQSLPAPPPAPAPVAKMPVVPVPIVLETSAPVALATPLEPPASVVTAAPPVTSAPAVSTQALLAAPAPPSHPVRKPRRSTVKSLTSPPPALPTTATQAVDFALAPAALDGSATNRPEESAAPRIRLMAGRQVLMPPNDVYAEIRLFQVKLKAPLKTPAISSYDVRVSVLFFDREPQTGAVAPTQAIVAPAEQRLGGDFDAQGEWTQNFVYLVPRTPGAASGRQTEFYGAIVQVYYDGVLQDERYEPESLRGQLPRSPTL